MRTKLNQLFNNVLLLRIKLNLGLMGYNMYRSISQIIL